MTPSSSRDPSVDWARAVAVLAMIQTHATDGWVHPDAKHSAAYGVTRLIATTPFAAFMLLAGMGLALRVRAGQARGECWASLRRELCARGLRVLGWGYVVSAAYAGLDGYSSIATFFRSDVLHVIGLSVAALALATAWGPGPVLLGRVLGRSAWLTAAVVLLSPLAYWLLPTPTGPVRYLLAPIWFVPGVSKFALLPIIGWAGLGVIVGALVQRALPRHGSRQVYAALAVGALGVSILCEFATQLLLADGMPLDQVHPAGIPNMIGYAGRGLVLIGLSPLLISPLPARVRSAMARLGRASLLAYALHLPFCYGTLAQPLRAQLDMPQVWPYLLSLCLLTSWVAVVVSERISRVASGESMRRGRPKT